MTGDSSNDSTDLAHFTAFGLSHSATVGLYTGFAVLLVLTAGIMSGTTLAVFSLEESRMKALANSGTPTEQARAKKLMPLLARSHWLLVTLLVCNAAAIESLPLVLQKLLTEGAVIAVSTIAVLIFGEIIPQSLFLRFAMPIASFLAYFLWVMMVLTSPISWTVGKLLDIIVGHKTASVYRRVELREIIYMNASHDPDEESDSDGDSSSDGDDNEGLAEDEVRMMCGALELSEATIESKLAVPLDDVFMLSDSERIDRAAIEKIFTCGFSRIPIYSKERTNITSYLLVKSLLPYIFKAESEAPLPKDCDLRVPVKCFGTEKLLALYEKFSTGRIQLAVVQKPTGEAMGIMTSNDMFQIVTQSTIYDETDLGNREPIQLLMKSTMQRVTRRVSRRNLARSSGLHGAESFHHRSRGSAGLGMRHSSASGYGTMGRDYNPSMAVPAEGPSQPLLAGKPARGERSD